MISVFLEFELGTATGADRAARIAQAAASKFVGLRGLRSKLFTYDPASGKATNIYVWESEEAARQFLTPAALEQVAGIYGAAPIVHYVQVVGLVDNSTLPLV